MSSDLEKIRGFALEKSNQHTSEACRLAEEHLPLWIHAIERFLPKTTVRQGKNDPIHFTYVENPGFLWGRRLSWENGSARLPIDLYELRKVPIDVYTTKLTLLLGKPFSVYHFDHDYRDAEDNYITSHVFSIHWE